MKKKENKKSEDAKKPFDPKPTRSTYAFKGLILILLGALLWLEVLKLEHTLAALLVLAGLKKIFYTLSH